MAKLKHLFRYLDTDGDGTGTTNAVGDYSSAATNFYIAPPAGESYVLHRMLLQIRDTGVIDAGGYGAAAALTNGITVEYHDSSGLVVDLTGGMPIKTNADWGRQCYDVAEVSFGAGDNYVAARWTFAKAGAPLVLRGDDGDQLRVVLNDSFVALTGHYFFVQGHSGLLSRAQQHLYE